MAAEWNQSFSHIILSYFFAIQMEGAVVLLINDNQNVLSSACITRRVEDRKIRVVYRLQLFLT